MRQGVKIVVAALAVLFAGCAATAGSGSHSRLKPADFTHYVDALFVDLYYRCERKDDLVRVAGFAQSSLRYHGPIVRFEVLLQGRDGKGKLLGRQRAYGDNLFARNIDQIGFDVRFLAPAGTASVDLEYRFEYEIGNGDGSGGGRADRFRPFLRQVRLEHYAWTIQDVCSETYRRKA